MNEAKKILEKLNNKWGFLFVAVLVYLIAAIFDADFAKTAFLQFAGLCVKILPAFALVFILMFLCNIFLDVRKIMRFLGEGSGIRGWALAIAGGVLSLGPIYMWYPMLADLKEKGMKDRFIAAFLYSRAVKIPLLPVMIYYFGLPFSVVINLYIILFSPINGFLVEKISKSR